MNRSVTIKAVLAGVVVSATALLAASPASSAGSASIDPEVMVPALARAQASKDVVPALGVGGSTRVRPETTRLLGDDRTGRFWVALGAEAQVCVVASDKSAPSVYAVACADRADFHRYGLPVELEIGAGEGGVAALMVPADVDSAALSRKLTGFQLAGDGLLVRKRGVAAHVSTPVSVGRTSLDSEFQPALPFDS